MTAEERVANIFANLVKTGAYPRGDFMCPVLKAAYRAKRLSKGDYELCNLAIQDFIESLVPSNLNPYRSPKNALGTVLVWYVSYRLDFCQVADAIVEIYTNWLDRYEVVKRLQREAKEHNL